MSSTGTSLSRYDDLIEAVREIALLEPGWNDYKDNHSSNCVLSKIKTSIIYTTHHASTATAQNT